MEEFVISLKRGIHIDDLSTDKNPTLEAVVKAIAVVRVASVLPTGRRMVVKVSPTALSRLRQELGDYCHFVPRSRGQVL